MHFEGCDAAQVSELILQIRRPPAECPSGGRAGPPCSQPGGRAVPTQKLMVGCACLVSGSAESAAEDLRPVTRIPLPEQHRNSTHWRTSSWSQEDPRPVNGGPPPGHRRPAPPRPLYSVTKKCSKQLDFCRNLTLSAHYLQSSALLRVTRDTLAERLRRRPAKPMGSPRVGSNPTGVVLVKVTSNIQDHNA